MHIKCIAADLVPVDLANISEVRVQTGCAVGSRSPDTVSKNSFSIMASPELSLLDLDAIHAAQFAEWVDGLRVLKQEVPMSTQESANYMHVSVAGRCGGGGEWQLRGDPW